MPDLKLNTKRSIGVPPVPPQAGNPSEFFGEETNDLQLNTVNDLDLVSGIEKLKQDINKILLTERGENPLFPLYGTEAQSTIGTKNNPDIIRATLTDEIIGGLQVLQFVNRTNPNDDERPETLETLEIEELADDQFEVRISVITASNQRVSTGVTISI